MPTEEERLNVGRLPTDPSPEDIAAARRDLIVLKLEVQRNRLGVKNPGRAKPPCPIDTLGASMNAPRSPSGTTRPLRTPLVTSYDEKRQENPA